MSGTKATGKTIGEVEQITGIPKRELKYFIEQGIIQPSQRSESGYWLYNVGDIRRVRLAALCRRLDFPLRSIRSVLANPPVRWRRELERQIVRLREQAAQTQSRLALAEALLQGDPDQDWPQEAETLAYILSEISESEMMEV